MNGLEGAIKAAIGAGISTITAPELKKIVDGIVAESGLTGADAKRLSDTIVSGIIVGITSGAGGSDAGGYAGNELKYNFLTKKELERRFELIDAYKACRAGAIECSSQDIAALEEEFGLLESLNNLRDSDLKEHCTAPGMDCQAYISSVVDKYKLNELLLDDDGPYGSLYKAYAKQLAKKLQGLPWASTDRALMEGMDAELRHVEDIVLAGITGGTSAGSSVSKIIQKMRGAKGAGAGKGTGAAGSISQAERLKASLAYQEIQSAQKVGSALKNDLYHTAADSALVLKQIPEKGRVFTKIGGDKKPYTLTQMEGSVNGVSGVFEWIVNSKGQLTHRTFVPKGKITGSPNGKLPINE